jgi:hypothetical protein
MLDKNVFRPNVVRWNVILVFLDEKLLDETLLDEPDGFHEYQESTLWIIFVLEKTLITG